MVKACSKRQIIPSSSVFAGRRVELAGVSTTSVLTATTLTYAIGAGITVKLNILLRYQLSQDHSVQRFEIYRQTMGVLENSANVCRFHFVYVL